MTQAGKIDNTDIESKINLRKQTVKDLPVANVLDLFAGESKLWGQIPHNNYLGFEIQKNKSKNVHADNLRAIPSLDLSKFNVIDIDGYGTPFEQVIALFENETLKSGTVCIYTFIFGGLMYSYPKIVIEKYKLRNFYKIFRAHFNAIAINYFYDILFSRGIKSVCEYSIKQSYEKRYGYFVIP